MRLHACVCVCARAYYQTVNINVDNWILWIEIENILIIWNALRVPPTNANIYIY